MISMNQGVWKHSGLILFAAVWLVDSICPPFLSYDSYWSVATGVNLVEKATTNVDRFVPAAPREADYGVECVPPDGPARLKYEAGGCPGGHWYSYFPLGAPRNTMTFAEGLAVTFFSPLRGLFVFTPLFLISLAGIWFGLRRRFPMTGCLAAILLLHSLVVMTIWPGHCYGPRYFADMTHVFLFLLIPAILGWQEQRGARRTACAAAFLTLAAWGVFVHAHGATSIAANQWSALPANVDDARWCVWDWSDAQFLRGLK
jgi:hypothetical protein